MSGLVWTFLGFARAYLLRMGGGFGFVRARNLAEKAPTLPHPLENRDIPFLPQVGAVPVASGKALPGAGLYPFERWSWVPAIGIPTGSNIPGRIRNLLAETFTRALSTAAILMGASLPRNWAVFKQPGAKAA